LVQQGASLQARYDPDQRTALHAAAEKGHLEVVAALLEAGADENAQTSSGKSALSLAVAQGHKDVAAVLLAAGADANSTDSEDRTPLHEAADREDLPMMQLLLAAGAGVYAASSRRFMPLHLASQANKRQAAALLLTSGAAVGAACAQGYTPLHYASKQGHLALVLMLLEACAPVEPKSDGGWTPLYLASEHNHSVVVKQLLRSGAQPDLPCGQGWVALHAASEYGCIEVVRLLLRANATLAHVNARGGNQQTPLHRACCTGQAEVVPLLLEAGADVAAGNVTGRTPLHHAAEGGHGVVVQQLLRAGAQPRLADNRGWVALHVAAELGHLQVVRCLLHADATPAHVNAQGAEGLSPLHWACAKGHDQVVPLLLGAGADVAARDVREWTPLHYATHGAHLGVLQQLLVAGADLRAATAAGVTGLHQAAMGGHLSVLEALLAAMGAGQGRAGLDVQHLGRTPLQWALEEGHISCVKVLAAAGADVNVLYGADAEAADGRSLAGATTLHRAVQLQRTALVPLLATPSNMGRLWKGQTPLHMALEAGDSGCWEEEEEEGVAVQMARTLVTAGSPVGLPDADGQSAMVLAAGSNNRGLRALLPAMVQRQCELYKQQQAQQQQGQSKQEVAASVTTDLVGDVYELLEVLADAAGLTGPALGAACFSCVIEALGEAAASSLLQGLLAKTQQIPGATTAASDVPPLLAQVLHRGWFKAVLPLMQRRWQVINRLHKLLPEHFSPQQQHAQQQQQQQQKAFGTQCAHSQCPELNAAAVAAAVAGHWPVFMQLLDQLTGLHEGCGGAVMMVLEQRLLHGSEGAPDVAGLCGALLGAWVAARQQVGGRARQELAGAVVAAVQAAGQQPVRAASKGS
jgi:ankyrin repeat protein